MADFESFFADQSERKNIVYTRPFQLPINVGFKIVEWQQCDSKFNRSKANRVLLTMDDFVSLQVYPGNKFDNFKEKDMQSFNEAIAKGQQSWYLVARHWTSKDRVPVDVISEATRITQKVPVFDCKFPIVYI